MKKRTTKNRLKVESVESSLPNSKTKSYYKLVNNGVANLDRIVEEMMKVNPGMEKETIEAILKLAQRTIMELTLNGMRVNTGLYSAVASPKGEGGSKWDKNKNKLDIKLTQGKLWRERIRETNIKVIGQKANVMYISNIKSNNEDGKIKAGTIVTVNGKYLRVKGDEKTTGIYFIDEAGEETKVNDTTIVINNPKNLTFIIPQTLKPGLYTMRISTMYINSTKIRKEPRTTEYTLTIEE